MYFHQNLILRFNLTNFKKCFGQCHFYLNFSCLLVSFIEYPLQVCAKCISVVKLIKYCYMRNLYSMYQSPGSFDCSHHRQLKSDSATRCKCLRINCDVAIQKKRRKIHLFCSEPLTQHNIYP